MTRIKPLEWSLRKTQQIWDAKCPISGKEYGLYYDKLDDRWRCGWRSKSFKKVEDAKQFAQEEFEARIRAVLIED